ncbi:MAG TPA: ATP synthase F1 subunit epsilon [Pyrinomonadaceae bacterium]|nr:ATP synthase F1 subunit epsilon [Pyrinomonadaceae bacterium]
MLKLEIVTPERKVVDAEVDSVTVPTMSGEAGILPNHAPLISALKPGVLSFSSKGALEKLAVAGGFVEVSADRVSVLTDVAEDPTEIDMESARSERDKAEKELAGLTASPIEETEELRERLEFANTKLGLGVR